MRKLLGGVVFILAGCSFTVARGFQECSQDADCGAGRACLSRYCIAMPEGCNRSLGATDASNKIPLAVLFPFTTGDAPLDSSTDLRLEQRLNAMTLALEEVNQRDGVGGRPFALYVCNTGNDRDRIKAQTQWMAEELSVPAVVASGSAQLLAAATETISRGVLLTSASASSPEITALLDTHEGSVGLVWRTAPSDAIQGRVIADVLLTDSAFAGVTKVGVVYVDDPYGQGLKEVLAARYGAVAGKEIRTFQYARSGDVSSAVDGLASFSPQVTVLIAFVDDAERILAAARQHTPPLPGGHRWFLTDSTKDRNLLSKVPAGELEGSMGTAPAQGAGQVFQSFSDRFRARFSEDPANFAFTSHSYDLMYLLALGAAHAVGGEGSQPVSGARMAEGLTLVSSGASRRLAPDDFTPAKTALQNGTSIDVEGASGKLNFDPVTGEAPSPIELWRVSGSGFTTVRVVEPPVE
ncbi:MAG: ABC transporter substrate-binding protein [Myxococcota bacterium]